MRHAPERRAPCSRQSSPRDRRPRSDRCYPEHADLTGYERMFYACAGCVPTTGSSRARSALNRVAGMPFDWSLNPYMGCVHRCTFCYVRAFELRADRPAGRALRHLDPGEVEHRRGARGASSRRRSWRRRERRDRRRDRSLPAGRGPLPAHPRPASRRSPRPSNPFGADHARAADRPRPRRARRGRPPGRRLGHVLGADARRGGLAADRARDGAAAPAAARARRSSSTPASAPRSGWRRSCRASPTGPSSSPRSSAPPARRAPAGSGRTCSTCGPGRASTSSSASSASWPELLPEYERLYGTRAYLRSADVEPVRDAVRELARADGIRDRRRVRLAPPRRARLSSARASEPSERH